MRAVVLALVVILSAGCAAQGDSPDRPIYYKCEK